MRAMHSLLSLAVVSLIFTEPVFADYLKGAQFYAKKEYERAYDELLPTAERGDARAQFVIAVMYDVGQHVTKDEKTAAIWYQKSAEQGHPHAQRRLASMFYEGTGVSLDREKAYQWAILAAERLVGPQQESADALAKSISSLLNETQRVRAQASIAAWSPHIAKPESSAGDVRRRLRTGNGIFLNTSGLLVTNEHIVYMCGRIVVSYGEAADEGVLRDVDFGVDLATVQTKFKPQSLAQFESGKLKIETPITVTGYAIEQTKSRKVINSSGQVLNAGMAMNNAAWFQTTASIYRGQSGSPVLDQSGQIVGIARGVLSNHSKDVTQETADGQAIAVKTDAIFRFLNRSNTSFEKIASNHASSAIGTIPALDFIVLLECWSK